MCREISGRTSSTLGGAGRSGGAGSRPLSAADAECPVSGQLAKPIYGGPGSGAAVLCGRGAVSARNTEASAGANRLETGIGCRNPRQELPELWSLTQIASAHRSTGSG
jgi:hypothetical protein